eukprot:2917-Eustigmatos_ZCMA.PRE.1
MGFGEADELARQKRAARFETGGSRRGRPVGRDFAEAGVEEVDFNVTRAVVGTCQELEKEYFRLNE